MGPSPSPDPLDDLQKRINDARDHSTLLPKKAASNNGTSASERSGLRAGGEILGGILGGLMFGYFADASFGTKPFGLVIGLLLGIVAGFYGVYRIIASTQTTSQAPDDKKGA